MAPPIRRERAALDGMARRLPATMKLATEVSQTAPTQVVPTQPNGAAPISTPLTGTLGPSPTASDLSSAVTVSFMQPTPSLTTQPASSNPTSLRPASSPTSLPTTSPTPDSGGIGGMSGGTKTGMVVAIIFIAALTALIVVYFILRRVRVKYKDPKYLPGKWLKSQWTRWDPAHQQLVNSNPQVARIARNRANILANQELDRHTSVRSVITLPPYREEPMEETERTIGREGERDGLDEVVVFPETQEEEERRREERMQAMYELRLQRRQQAAEREARRATRAGSSTTSLADSNNALTTTTSLTANAANAEAGGSSTTRGRSANDLTAAILNDRTRRSSEVAYHEIGSVRLDGSRVRASSTASNPGGDSAPLLGSSASGGGRRSRTGSTLSLATSNPNGGHRDSTDIAGGAVSADVGIQRLPPSYDGLEWGDAPPYISPVSPVSRRNSIERDERDSLMSVPVLTVSGPSNPNSPHPDAHFTH